MRRFSERRAFACDESRTPASDEGRAPAHDGACAPASNEGRAPAHYGACAPAPGARRLLKAIAIVVALVVAAPFIDSVAKVASPQLDTAAQSAFSEGLDARAIIGAKGADEALEQIERAGEPAGRAVPRVFSDEIGMLPGARDVRVNEDGSVIGYLVEEDARTVFDAVSAAMEARGWSSVALGEEGAATFVKSGGHCTWALVTCTQTGAATSVVVRSVVA